MAERKTRLGRGLAELLGEAPPEHVEEAALSTRPAGERPAAGGAVKEVAVTELRPNPRQPRREMDRESLEELAESMRSLGIVQPIIVRKIENGFEIIAGERRWRAAQLAGFTVVPVIVREASDAESLEIALVENVVRRQLNPVDEAYALQVLLEDLGVTQDALASRLGRSRPTLTNKLRLLDLPKPVQELIAHGELSEGHGRALLGLRGRGEQIKLAQKAAARGWSVRTLEAEVKKLTRQADIHTGAQDPIVPQQVATAAEDRFSQVFRVPVRVKASASGGKVEIPFRSAGELEEILSRLSQ